MSPPEGAANVVRLYDPTVEIVNGAYYDRDARKRARKKKARRKKKANHGSRAGQH